MRIFTVLLLLYCTTVMSYSGLQTRPVIDHDMIIKNMKPVNTWDYSVLFDKINNNDVIWVRISQDGKYVITIDKTNINAHYITTIPLHMDSLINKLLEMNIPFDIVTTITDMKVK